jgi:hypothetical protein
LYVERAVKHAKDVDVSIILYEIRDSIVPVEKNADMP